MKRNFILQSLMVLGIAIGFAAHSQIKTAGGKEVAASHIEKLIIEQMHSFNIPEFQLRLSLMAKLLMKMYLA